MYTNVPRAKPQLREQAIDPRDLIELDAKTYGEMKLQGIDNSTIKSRLNTGRETHDINFDLSFVPPKKEYYAKTAVFLPMKNQHYNDLQNNISVLPQQQTPIRTFASPYQLPTTTTSYGSRPNNEPVVVSRILQKSDGTVVSLPLSRY